MPPVKSISAAAAKWVRNAGAGATSYSEGISTAPIGAATAGIAAKDAYATATQAAIARGAYEKGLREAGDEKWKRGALEKGVSRFPQGVSVGEPHYAQKTGPYFDVIASTTLPPRRGKGDPGNFERVIRMANALRNKRTGGK